MAILQAAALYFALAFAAGWVLGPVREFWVIPRFGRTAGLLIEAPVMLLVSFLAARRVVGRLTAPPTLATRALLGLVALGLLLAAEIVGSRWLRGLSLANYLSSFRSLSGAITAATFLLFAAMPMLVRSRRSRA